MYERVATMTNEGGAGEDSDATKDYDMTQRPQAAPRLASEIRRSEDTGAVVFVGQARLPQALGGPGGSTAFTVEAEVDLSSGHIVDVLCYPASEICQRLVRATPMGRDLRGGLDDAATEIQRRYVGPAQRAIATAISNVYETYARWSPNGQAASTAPRRSRTA